MKIKKCSVEGCTCNRRWSRGLCRYHFLKLNPPKPIKKVPLKKTKNKSTGELVLFNAIWATRPHVCQVTGDPIKEFSIWCFMHVLSKKSYGKFRLFDKNILLVLPGIHHEYDNGDRSLPLFKQVNILHDELITLYYEK